MINLHAIETPYEIPDVIKLIGVWFRKCFPQSRVRFYPKYYKPDDTEVRCLDYTLYGEDWVLMDHPSFNISLWELASRQYSVFDFEEDMIEIV